MAGDKSHRIGGMLALLVMLAFSLVAAAAEEKEKDGQSQMQRFSQRFSLIEAVQKSNGETWNGLNRRYLEMRNIREAEDYLEAAFRLSADLARFSKNLEVAGAEQVDFKNRLERYSESNMLLQQELDVIAGYMNNLQIYGKQQNEQVAVAARTMRQLNAAMAKFPPPAEFTLDGGMRFVLVAPVSKSGRRRIPFYALTAPVTRQQWLKHGGEKALAGTDDAEEEEPVGNVNLKQVNAFIRTFSHGVGAQFYLPSSEQIRLMAENGGWRALGSAVWMAGAWSEDYEEGGAAERFKVAWNCVWDPASVLGGTVKLSEENPGICPEVPQAAYRQLGILLVTDLDTGRTMRLARIRKAVEAEQRQQDAGEEERK